MKKIVAMADKLARQTPAGWTSLRGSGSTDGAYEIWPNRKGEIDSEWVTFKRDFATVALNVTLPYDAWAKKNAFEGMTVFGHTLVDGCSFTRYGVDTSSCDLVSDATQRYSDHAYGDLASLLAGEFERCRVAKERRATAVAVPGLPFTVQPAWFEKTAATLKAGKPVRLVPAGFGTGYTLTSRATSRYAKRSAELESKLGVMPVYVESFDHD